MKKNSEISLSNKSPLILKTNSTSNLKCCFYCPGWISPKPSFYLDVVLPMLLFGLGTLLMHSPSTRSFFQDYLKLGLPSSQFKNNDDATLDSSTSFPRPWVWLLSYARNPIDFDTEYYNSLGKPDEQEEFRFIYNLWSYSILKILVVLWSFLPLIGLLMTFWRAGDLWFDRDESSFSSEEQKTNCVGKPVRARYLKNFF